MMMAAKEACDLAKYPVSIVFNHFAFIVYSSTYSTVSVERSGRPEAGAAHLDYFLVRHGDVSLMRSKKLYVDRPVNVKAEEELSILPATSCLETNNSGTLVLSSTTTSWSFPQLATQFLSPKNHQTTPLYIMEFLRRLVGQQRTAQDSCYSFIMGMLLGLSH